MKTKINTVLIAASILVSGWIYWNNEFQVERLLTSHEWQSKMVTVVLPSQAEPAVGPLRQADVNSNVKYLTNGTYIRVATARLYTDNSDNESVIFISETGDWSISDNYLLISPTSFKDDSSPQSKKDFTQEQLQVIAQLFRMEAEQSRRVDVVNDKTLLLTSLNHGSTVMFAN
ncbi:regulatory protein ToxS [Vibrio sp.]|uniref:regulatory protein ToxS n=1 Tax=Vibrio sp. TaxID=678 RepID=UPI003D149698